MDCSPANNGFSNMSLIAALLTNTSSRPYLSNIRCFAVSRDPRSVTSITSARCPSPSPAATDLAAASSRSAATTFAPAAASASQCCLPSRPQAPVTTATLSARENSSILYLYNRFHIELTNLPEHRFNRCTLQPVRHIARLHRVLQHPQHFPVRRQRII